MEGCRPRAVFLGDLNDPWVADLAAALPRDAILVSCDGDLPDAWPWAPTLVVHRPILTPADADRLRRWRAGVGKGSRVVLCVGPHARYHLLQSWLAWVDVVVPEAVAVETVARHLGAVPGLPDPRPRPRVAVVSDNFELGQVLTEACDWAGYPTHQARCWDEAVGVPLVVWDVPLLVENWPLELGRQAHGRWVLALLGFADRATVATARAAGASACLDLPCEPADLAHVLDRLATSWSLRPVHPPHEVPPAPLGRRRRNPAQPARPQSRLGNGPR